MTTRDDIVMDRIVTCRTCRSKYAVTCDGKPVPGAVASVFRCRGCGTAYLKAVRDGKGWYPIVSLEDVEGDSPSPEPPDGDGPGPDHADDVDAVLVVVDLSGIGPAESSPSPTPPNRPAVTRLDDEQFDVLRDLVGAIADDVRAARETLSAEIVGRAGEIVSRVDVRAEEIKAASLTASAEVKTAAESSASVVRTKLKPYLQNIVDGYFRAGADPEVDEHYKEIAPVLIPAVRRLEAIAAKLAGAGTAESTAAAPAPPPGLDSLRDILQRRIEESDRRAEAAAAAATESAARAIPEAIARAAEGYFEGRARRLDVLLANLPTLFDAVNHEYAAWDDGEDLKDAERDARPIVLDVLGRVRRRVEAWQDGRRIERCPAGRDGPIPFNDRLHDRINVVPIDDESKIDTIHEVVDLGYLWQGEPIRRAQVVTYARRRPPVPPRDGIAPAANGAAEGVDDAADAREANAGHV